MTTAVRFDAAGDRCTWTGTAPTPSSGLTITCWVYISVNRSDFSTVLRLHSSSGATTNLNIAMDSGGLLPCVFTAGGSSTGPQSLSVGAWARLAVTVTGSTSTIYVALGAAGATQSQAGTVGGNAAVSPTSGYTVAGRSAVDPDEWFNGRLAHIRVWSAVLTQGEAEAEWASATPVRTSDLFADYPLPDAGDLTDHSGNGRNLSAGSTSVTTEDGPPIDTAVTGTAAHTLTALDSTAGGAVLVSGTAAATLPALDTATAGAVTVAGAAAVDLPAMHAALAGGVVNAGVGNTDLSTLDVNANVSVSVDGTTSVTLPPLDSAAVGAMSVAGVAQMALPAIDIAAQGAVIIPVVGTVGVTLPALTMASATLAWPPAVTEDQEHLVGVDGPYRAPWLAVD